MAEEILGTFVLEQLSNSYSLDENMQTLRRKLEELSCRETDINSELENVELYSGKKRKREVENWLRNVEKKKNEVQSIEQELGERRFFSHVKLGKRVKKMIGEVTDLVQQGNFPEGLIVEACETRGDALPTTWLVGQTSQRNLEKIWACLMNDEVLSIGIYGMGGVGKTTVTMHIHNRILEYVDSFKNVYWITVSQEFSIHRLQSDIAKAVGHNISHEEDEKRRAAQLFKVLMKRKDSVLILDDMWDHFPLEKVGIPIGVNGCKLVLTTRSLDVCRRMGCQEIIKVEPLSREEAWMLFKEKLGNNIALPPNVNEIAKSVVDRCAGLPLGIITMAGTMRGVDDICEWRNVLEELKESMAGQSDMESDVFPILNFSYNHLKDSRLQFCFLYCALYPEDSYLERQELIEYFIAEGLIDGRKSRQAEFDLGHSILNKLENACLLESVKGFRSNRCMKMHDLIREMALQITRASPRYMVKAGMQLRELPQEQEWTEDLEKVSLMKNEISKIPSGTSPRCPRLSTLILRDNPLERLPYTFLLQLPSLTVLDLSHTDLENLPNSISDLECLTALLLNWCEQLIFVPSLAKLRALQVLNLSYTKIRRVPQGLEILVNLKSLNMHQTWNLEMIPAGILSGLSSLQQLMLDYSSEHVTVKAEELMSLRNLEEFEGQLYDLEIDECQIEASCLCDISSSLSNARELKACAVIHCDGIESILSSSSYSSYAPLQSLEKLDLHGLQNLSTLYKWGRGDVAPPHGTFSSLKRLDISGCPSIKKLFTPHLLQHLHNLEHLYIWECKQMEEIIAVDNESSSSSNQSSSSLGIDGTLISFPKLNRLSLQQLPELKSICRGTMACESIQSIAVIRCPKLKRLPLSLLPSNEQQSHPPPSLEEILIDDKQWWESLEWNHPNHRNILQPSVRFW